MKRRSGTVSLAVVLSVVVAVLAVVLVGGIGAATTFAQDDVTIGPAELCDPVFPTTFVGTVTVDGVPAADGTTITAWDSDGVLWATDTTSGGSYAVDVPDHLPTAPPCFLYGTISFQCDGAWAAETGEATGGLKNLNLTCGAGPVVGVAIDIKPGHDPNSVNLKSGGSIPVAILTTATFDALTVDADTALFEGAAAQPHPRAKDVDRDGDLDLLLSFRIRETDLVPGQTEACLTGQTYDGVPIRGCDSVKTAP